MNISFITGMLLGGFVGGFVVALCKTASKETPPMFTKSWETTNGTLTIDCNDKETFKRFVNQYESIIVR
jgi:hypothetical protein